MGADAAAFRSTLSRNSRSPRTTSIFRAGAVWLASSDQNCTLLKTG
jgi:hypothetical protein